MNESVLISAECVIQEFINERKIKLLTEILEHVKDDAKTILILKEIEKLNNARIEFNKHLLNEMDFDWGENGKG